MLPDAGDIAWIEFDPVRGKEPASRPALVLTPQAYHQRSTRALVCPITSNMKPWPFKIILPEGLKTTGAVLVDQLQAIDRSERLFTIIERAPREVLLETLQRLAALLDWKNPA
ncbi:MAG: type II toxin-antitoxin system PemK/MazF family toxin [Xanthobacteraceae bacterium]